MIILLSNDTNVLTFKKWNLDYGKEMAVETWKLFSLFELTYKERAIGVRPS